MWAWDPNSHPHDNTTNPQSLPIFPGPLRPLKKNLSVPSFVHHSLRHFCLSTHQSICLSFHLCRFFCPSDFPPTHHTGCDGDSTQNMWTMSIVLETSEGSDGLGDSRLCWVSRAPSGRLGYNCLLLCLFYLFHYQRCPDMKGKL